VVGAPVRKELDAKIQGGWRGSRHQGRCIEKVIFNRDLNDD
jgi:hypothetical protein